MSTGQTASDSVAPLAPRFPAAGVAAIASTRLSPGGPVALVNISSSGALVQTSTRFVPGTRLNVVFDGPVTPSRPKGRVVRCALSPADGEGQPLYLVAIAFDSPIALPARRGSSPAGRSGRGAGAERTAADGHAAPLPHNSW